jgi:hypothetical protein
MKQNTILALLLACCFYSLAFAQDDPDPIEVQLAEPEETEVDVVEYVPVIEKTFFIRVDSIKRFNTAVGGDPYHGKSGGNCIRQGNYVMVCIHPDDMDSAQINAPKLRLWMDGICYQNMRPLFINPTEHFLIFRILRDTIKTSPWQLMYQFPEYLDFHHTIRLNLGTESVEFRHPNFHHFLDLDTTIAWMPIVFYPLLALLLFFLIRYGKKMIKDVGLYAKNGVKITYSTHEITNREAGVIHIDDIPYSLSRFQFLLWLIVIFISIIHIWIITNILISPTSSVLVLLGISGGTFYISKMLDSPAPPPGDPKTPSELVGDFIDNDQKSKGLLIDMLNDGKSMSLHRLQLLLFTVFLGCYFITQVIGQLILPQISETMMGLMGISSVTYAGLKSTEQQPAA